MEQPKHVFVILASVVDIPFVKLVIESSRRFRPSQQFVIFLGDLQKREWEELKKDCVSLLELESYATLWFPCDLSVDGSSLAEGGRGSDYSRDWRPSLVRKVEGRFGQVAISFMGASCFWFDNYDELENLLCASSVVLVPQCLSSFDNPDRLVPNVTRGAFSEDYLGINLSHPDSQILLKWWEAAEKNRLAQEINLSEFVQRYLFSEWVCVFPSIRFLKDPGYFVGPMNLHERFFTRNGSAFMVNGKPLKSLILKDSFSEEIGVLAAAQTDLPVVGDAFRAAVEGLDSEFRTVLKARFDGDQILNLGLSDTRGLVSSKNQSVMGRILNTQRHFLGDVYLAIKRMLVYNARLVAKSGRWVVVDGLLKLRRTAVARFTKARRKRGVDGASAVDSVNVFGYLTSELGLGESARGLIAALDAAGIPANLYDCQLSTSRKGDLTYVSRLLKKEVVAPVSLVHIGIEQTSNFFRSRQGQLALKSKKKIAYWYWELEEFPELWKKHQVFFDEIWVATDFVKKSLEGKLAKPIRVIPPAYVAPARLPLGREFFGLPKDKFVFLTVFDGFSYVQRKNPVAVIEAFRMAMANSYFEGKAILVIKAINLSEREIKSLEQCSAGLPVKLINRYFSRAEMHELYSCSDCLISLHRGEGLGLSMIEAMDLGKPVIATGYSGNMSFMSEDNAFLVPFEKKPIGQDQGHYLAQYHWADADVEAAARSMIEVVHAPLLVAKRAANARESISAQFDRNKLGVMIRTSLS